MNNTATTEISTLTRPGALPISRQEHVARRVGLDAEAVDLRDAPARAGAEERARHRVLARGRPRSEEHTSELQSRQYLVCRLLLEKKILFVSLVSSTPFLVFPSI